MPCELSFAHVVVVMLLILIIYNWRDTISTWTIDRVPERMEVPQYLGYGRPPGSGGSAMSLSQKQSGGIAGINVNITLNADGHWVKSAQGGFTDSGSIPADLAKKILAKAEQSEPSSNEGNCFDCFRYEVAMTYPSTQVVHKTLDQSVFPSSLGF